MIEIIPAIIPKSIEDLKEKLEKVHKLARFVQIDMVDGKFAPRSSWPYGEENEKSFQEIVSEEKGLPFWEDFDFEADLMIENPEESIDDFIKAGFARLIVHIESTSNVEKIITNVKESGTSICIAQNIQTPTEELEKWIDKIDGVQLMGISRIGFQGEPFDERVIPKIKYLRERYPNLIISIDGGVNLQTAPRLISAGANRLVAGSAIFGSEDIKRTIKDFQVESDSMLI